jgi:hypothetical protein
MNFKKPNNAGTGIFMYPMERNVRMVPGRLRENRATRNPVFLLGMATDILENMSIPVVKALKKSHISQR